MPKTTLESINKTPRQEPSHVIETNSPQPTNTYTNELRSPISNSNPLGEINKNNVTPPKYAKTANTRSPNTKLFGTKVKPTIAPSGEIPKIENKVQTNVKSNIKSNPLSPNTNIAAKEPNKETGFQLTSMTFGILAAVLLISLMVGVIYIVLTTANQAASSITLTANAVGGTPPYTYQWSAGLGCANPIIGQTGSSAVFTGTLSSSYSVAITDASSNTVCNGYNV